MTTIALPRMALPRPALPHLPRVDRALARQLLRYMVVGGLGTAVSAVLYLVFRMWWDAVPANLAALVLSTVASTEANRRFTFGGRSVGRCRVYLQNAGTVVFYAFYSSAVLVLLGDLVDQPTALQETTAVAAASVLGGLLRFVVLRNWVFHAPGAGATRTYRAEWRDDPVRPGRPAGERLRAPRGRRGPGSGPGARRGAVRDRRVLRHGHRPLDAAGGDVAGAPVGVLVGGPAVDPVTAPVIVAGRAGRRPWRGKPRRLVGWRPARA